MPFGKERSIAFWAMMAAQLAAIWRFSWKLLWCVQAAGGRSSAPIPQGHSAVPPCTCSCSPAHAVHASAIRGCRWQRESPAATIIRNLKTFFVFLQALSPRSHLLHPWCLVSWGPLQRANSAPLLRACRDGYLHTKLFQWLPLVPSFIHSSIIVYWMPDMCQTLCEGLEFKHWLSLWGED